MAGRSSSRPMARHDVELAQQRGEGYDLRCARALPDEGGSGPGGGAGRVGGGGQTS